MQQESCVICIACNRNGCVLVLRAAGMGVWNPVVLVLHAAGMGMLNPVVSVLHAAGMGV